MNKEDRKTVISWMVELNLLKGEITDLGRSWDANSKSIMSLKDEIHELQPRYEEIVKLLKNKGFKSIRTFDDLTANEMSAWLRTVNKQDLKNLKRYFPDDAKDVELSPDEEPLKFAKAKDIQPNLNRRNTDNRDATMRSPERRSRPKILSFFGLGRLKVEL